jgi:hypothetical protein
MKVLSGMTQPGWGYVTIWYQSPVFDTEPELGRISGYGRKISEGIVVEREKFEFQSIPECQENTLVMLRSSGGIAVQESQ